MRYFRIYESSDNKVIGRKFPQAQPYSVATSANDPLFLGHFLMGKAPENAVVPTGMLEKRAKRTDLISTVGYNGFLYNLYLSDKLGQLLLQHKSAYMQFFSTKLYEQNGNEHPYWIVHAHQFSYEMLDLEQSFVGHYTSINLKELIRRNTITDAEVLKQELAVYLNRTEDDSAVGTICITKPVFKQDMDLDFFALRPVYGGTGFYVSEALKNQIEAAGCTGMVFTGPDERYP
jgi:hypothetical protein